MAKALIKYDAMIRAISAAYKVDEVKDIRDKAIALEMYSRQARNTEAERRACEIRLRAERKAGQLSAKLDKAAGRPSKIIGTVPKISKAQQLRKAGVSRDQARQWEKLAAVPDRQFEAALSDGTRMPTTGGIIKENKTPKPDPVTREALWLWGRLADFQRNGMLEREPADVLETMTSEMLDDVFTLAPRVAAWLKKIGSVKCQPQKRQAAS